MIDATATPQELRNTAAAHLAKAEESYERCGTDGFVSQWADQMHASQHSLEAEIRENGGRARFPALFDTDGNLIAAKRVNGRYGTVWGLLPDDDPDGRFTGWFNPSKAERVGVARRTDAKKGYYVGYVMARAKAKISASGTGLAGAVNARAIAVRIDGGFSRDVIIVDNGHGDTNLNRWYGIHDGTYTVRD